MHSLWSPILLAQPPVLHYSWRRVYFKLASQQITLNHAEVQIVIVCSLKWSVITESLWERKCQQCYLLVEEAVHCLLSARNILCGEHLLESNTILQFFFVRTYELPSWITHSTGSSFQQWPAVFCWEVHSTQMGRWQMISCHLSVYMKTLIQLSWLYFWIDILFEFVAFFSWKPSKLVILTLSCHNSFIVHWLTQVQEREKNCYSLSPQCYTLLSCSTSIFFLLLLTHSRARFYT